MSDDEAPTIDLGTEVLTEQVIPLEEKYRQQMRQIVSQKIELPISTLTEMIDEQINLDPDFQRRDRWDQEKRSRFIESIVMNVPIPPVFLGENEYGKYVVLDGRQRLTAIYEFMQNRYALKGLKVWGEINDSTYHDLQKQKLERTITRRFIPAVVILKESSPQVKYDVFDRLNTGGVIALPMEIRNAVYNGEFNKLLHTLSDDKTFRQLWGIPIDDIERESNALYKRMDDLELVLRFFALRDYGEINMRFKEFLSDFMQRRNERYKLQPGTKEEDRLAFQQATQNGWRIFGESAFTKPGSDNRKSAPLADAVMIALAEVPPTSINDTIAERIRSGFADLCVKSDEFKKAIGTGTNGKGAIRTRIEATSQLVKQTLEAGGTPKH